MKYELTSCRLVRAEAENLGIFELPLLTLYTQPRYVYKRMPTQTFAWRIRLSNCLVEATEQFFRAFDPNTMMCRKGHHDNRTILAPKLHALAKFETRNTGFNRGKPANLVVRVDIWADADITEQLVERLIWAQNGDPIGDDIDWDKIEQAFAIQRADAIAQWRAYIPLK